MLEIRPILSTLLRHKSSTLLIILQIAFTLAVVVNAVHIITKRISMMSTESGVPESELFSFNIQTFGRNENLELNFRADQELVRNLPGVIDAVVINAVPMGGGGDSSSVSASEDGPDVNAAFYAADSHLLNTLGVSLVEGRNFTEEEVEYPEGTISPNVAIISQALAKQLYGDESPVGKPLYFAKQLTVIGVADYLVSPWVNTKNFEKIVLVPSVALRAFKRMLVRVEPSMMNDVMRQVEQKLIERNPNRVINGIISMGKLRERSYRQDTAMGKILSVVIILLIVITALGIVGIVSFNINQRIKQIGTRRALGASRLDIQGYFLTENILLTLIGVTFGSILAVAFNIYLVDNFELPPLEGFYIAIGTLIMLLTGIFSVWFPALKASRISPAVATQSI